MITEISDLILQQEFYKPTHTIQSETTAESGQDSISSISYSYYQNFCPALHENSPGTRS